VAYLAESGDNAFLILELNKLLGQMNLSLESLNEAISGLNIDLEGDNLYNVLQRIDRENRPFSATIYTDDFNLDEWTADYFSADQLEYHRFNCIQITTNMKPSKNWTMGFKTQENWSRRVQTPDQAMTTTLYSYRILIPLTGMERSNRIQFYVEDVNSDEPEFTDETNYYFNYHVFQNFFDWNLLKQLCQAWSNSHIIWSDLT
jgi:hypothetical protein